MIVDEEVAPYAFVHIRGHVTLSEAPAVAAASFTIGATSLDDFVARFVDLAPFPPSRSFWLSLDLGF